MILPSNDEMNEIRGTAYAKPATTWDPIFGYRWNNGENRMLRVARGEIVADRKYKFNNYHQNCTFDYTPRKSAENIYRLVVLGDSFTNDIMLRTAWPETLQHLLNSRKEFGIDFEVYSFPTDGGGLVNWHATFRHLIEKEFDYDALVIADWGDDLARDWTMMESNATEFRYIRVAPQDKPKSCEEFEALLPCANILADIKSEEWIEAMVQKLKKNAHPRTMTPADYFDGQRSIPTSELPPDNYQFSKESFMARYGELRYSMLQEMLAICQTKGKTVIYSPMPTRDGLISLQNEGKKLMAQVQGEALCKHFGIHFFDGFDAFREINNQSLVDFYWLKYDGHWNLGASMHYAMKLADWIFRTKLFLQNSSKNNDAHKHSALKQETGTHLNI